MIGTGTRIDGVVIGVFIGFGDRGPLVVYPGNPAAEAQTARTLSELTIEMAGNEVALMFEGGDARKPLIVGRIIDPEATSRQLKVIRDGDSVRISADKRIELRCGKSTIIMENDGRIVIRGKHLISHASASNRIRGGSVNLN